MFTFSFIILMTHSNVVVSKTLDGAHYSNGTLKRIPLCLFHNHDVIYNKMVHIINRTYSDPFKWYFITFKPFNKNYERDIDFYTHKAFDHCRKKVGKVDAYIMTREIKATKIHINIIVASKRPLTDLLHEKHTNKYFIYCQECRDHRETFEYIIKESRERTFKEYLDYVYHC